MSSTNVVHPPRRSTRGIYQPRSALVEPVHRRFIKNSCSCGARVEMNLTSLALPYTTHARAVDGNHQFPALLRPVCPFAVVGRREMAEKGCRIDFFPCWKAFS